jgi:hypothetical protein
MAKGSLTIAVMQVSGLEIVIVLVDRLAIADMGQSATIMRTAQKLMPGKKIILAAEDKFTAGQPTIFAGPPNLTGLFRGRRAGDFKWSIVTYS